jgi:hypothetical protein
VERTTDSDGQAPPDGTCAFYGVANARHFIGAVALLNSLRLVGHAEPFYLVDAGLTDEQRLMLSGHVEFLPAPEDVLPGHLAPYGPLQRPADVQVILDADIIVTRPLTELVATGHAGRFVGFVNDPPNHDRFFPEWGPAIGLGPLRRRPYLNAGQFVLPRAMNDRLLGPWLAGQDRIGVAGTRYYSRGVDLANPFYFSDQDVVNAVLAACLDDGELDVREHRLAPHPPFADLQLLDPARLLCRYPDGERPFVLHHTHGKPWLQATRHNVYSALLPRLLLAPDVAVRLRPDQVPLRLRESLAARADRRRADLQALVKTETRRRLGTFGIRTRLAARRRRSRSVPTEPTG